VKHALVGLMLLLLLLLLEMCCRLLLHHVLQKLLLASGHLQMKQLISIQMQLHVTFHDN